MPVEIDFPAPETAPGAVADWLAWATAALDAHSDSPRADAERLLAGLLACDYGALILRRDEALESALVLRYVAWVERRKLGEPVAYITARQGFWTLDLVVDSTVLIPRPDTETLVEWALEIARGALKNETSFALADLGTGSGAIALALASELRNVSIVATDYSPAALDIARENAQALPGVNVEFVEGSWFEPLAGRSFDLIVSNPPYIAEGDPHLPALRYEPRSALTSGPDGLAALRAITAGAVAYLQPGGRLLLEHGADQAAAVQALLQNAGFIDIATRRDLGGNARVTGARRP